MVTVVTTVTNVPPCKQNQSLIGHADSEGNLRFRFSPKHPKVYRDDIRSNVASLDGRTGEILSVSPRLRLRCGPTQASRIGGRTDPSRALAVGVHHSTKMVNQWHEDCLRDFAVRLLRCLAPVPAQ